MRDDLAEIAFVLDCSGSMQTIADSTIGAFNSFLRDQQEAPGNARLTLTLFNDISRRPVDGVPVAEVLPLTSETYVPGGCTALLDAIGQTIVDLGSRLAAIPEAERPATVIVPILTDGLENASVRYTMREVSELIRHQTEVYKWQFLFLGANQDAIATAANLNIDRRQAATFRADDEGAKSSIHVMALRTTSSRARAMKAATSDQVEDDKMSVSELMEKEKAKRRNP